MSLVYPNMQLSEVVEENPSLISVIHRFGIRLGLGDATVQEICDTQKLNTDFFLTMINTFLNEDYFPEKKLQGFHTSQMVDYLTKTNHYYERHQLPNIERHLRSFISMSDPDHSPLSLIEKIFTSFKDTLLNQIRNDEKEWFPYCLSLSNQQTETNFTLEKNDAEDTDDSIEALLTDLQRILIKHLTGVYDVNLCHAVIFSISILAKDIKQHNRIRFRILQPIVTGMEKNSL